MLDVGAPKWPSSYAWVILAATGVIGLMVGGLGHFADTLSLPSIRTDLQLSYAQTGFLVTSNFTGSHAPLRPCSRACLTNLVRGSTGPRSARTRASR